MGNWKIENRITASVDKSDLVESLSLRQLKHARF